MGQNPIKLMLAWARADNGLLTDYEVYPDEYQVLHSTAFRERHFYLLPKPYALKLARKAWADLLHR